VLAGGDTTEAAGKMFGVGPVGISELPKYLQESWLTFQVVRGNQCRVTIADGRLNSWLGSEQVSGAGV
jgi:hypothetical protein